MTTARRTIAARLLVDEDDLEQRSLKEVKAELEALGIDPTAVTERAQRQVALLNEQRIGESHETKEGLQAAGSHLDVPLVRRRPWFSPQTIVGLLRLSDGAIVLLTALWSWVYLFYNHPTREVGVEGYAGALAVLLTLHIFERTGLYDTERLASLFDQMRRLFFSWSAVILILLSVGFMTKELEGVRRLWVGLWFVYGLAGLSIVRLLVNQQIRSWRRDGVLTERVAVIGMGVQVHRLVEHIAEPGDGAERIVKVFDGQDSEPRAVIEELLPLVRRGEVDQVIVVPRQGGDACLARLLETLFALPIDVLVYPDVAGVEMPHLQVRRVAGMPMLQLARRPLAGWNRVVKAIEDRALAALFMLIMLPLTTLIMLAIRLESPGPAFVRERRYDLSGAPIDMYRFRTLYRQRSTTQMSTITAYEEGQAAMTRVGSWLHRHSLDELPQFINVLLGTMSIVGPRPSLTPSLPGFGEGMYGEAIKPGITGWAQVNGIRGESLSAQERKRRDMFDRYYIQHWSLLFDLRIMLRTLSVFRRRSLV